jgi:hypothetical protein
VTRWRGLSDLVQDAVHHGTVAVEKVHQSVARTPLDVLALVQPLAPAARWAAAWQATIIAGTYATIRGVNAAAGMLVGACIEAAPRSEPRGDVESDHGSSA